MRIPKNLTADIICGQMNKRGKIMNRTKQEQKQHQLLKQFHVKDLPKQRFFDVKVNNPLSDSYLNGSHDSENSLREFLGYESESD